MVNLCVYAIIILCAYYVQENQCSLQWTTFEQVGCLEIQSTLFATTLFNNKYFLLIT